MKNKELLAYLEKAKVYQSKLFADFERFKSKPTYVSNESFWNSFLIEYNLTEKDLKPLTDSIQKWISRKNNLLLDKFVITWTIDSKFSLYDQIPKTEQKQNVSVSDTILRSSVSQLNSDFNEYINKLIEENYIIEFIPSVLLLKENNVYKLFIDAGIINEQ
ncbi:MSC_0623 family F1-like ATPase-associated protein [Mycoplasma sp. 2248]|uniref:MSC_0623 family F1-like ATPase-associated protein n=1 Tax=Mycoplasma sp. 2248 TaxID=3108528 RepID=UPI002B1DD741|nr:DUF2714 domain-containing protein [Mycoplasma sp. 2248]MEA4191174.1 DUF2714 domain-containing protein [Mycoplasma sp. 2248]